MSEEQRHRNSTLWAHPIEAIAFDMDGLMVNTEDLYTIVGDRILQRRGKRFSDELKRKMMGLPGPQAFQIMIEEHQLSDTPDILAAETEEIFPSLLASDLEVLPGLLELLDWIETREIPKCVATSSSHRFAAEVLHHAEIGDRFDFVITAEDVPSGKPSPDIYLAAAERMGTLSERMLVLEDSQHGSTAGVRSGACTVAVPGEHSRDHDFSHVAWVADSLGDEQIRDLIARE